MVDDFGDWGKMDYIHPSLIVTNPALAMLLPERVAREHNVLPQGVEGRVLKILISDPNDFFTMDLLRFVLGSCAEVRFALSSRQAIHEAIERVYATSGL